MWSCGQNFSLLVYKYDKHFQSVDTLVALPALVTQCLVNCTVPLLVVIDIEIQGPISNKSTQSVIILILLINNLKSFCA